MADIIIGPSIALGLAIGIYEATLLHRDVQVKAHRFGHTVHALILSIGFVFATMNVDFMLSVIPQLGAIPVLGNPHVFRVIIGVIAAIKIHGTSKAIQSGGSASVGLGETWFHSILVGALIVAAPYAYPFVAPVIPSWLAF
tara:strand:- start:438 stop:860 length:423 start_codon:yes stop_codon:yes gene_type:complete